jgi:N utilization substance protein B
VKRRHRARRLALQALSCLDVQGLKARSLAEGFIEESRDPPDVRSGAMDLLAEAIDDRDASDQLVAQHARHWGIERMPVVDRNILRLAVSELSRGRTPPKVVITEALLLAREFSSAESPRFVNGVLDSIAKHLAPHGDLTYRPPTQETRN